ncbi:MAG: DUF3592 domain-containing protein [Thermoanaerobaculia bacterium]|nr:DUF3592 domain-containing protein [Thermoanaerobaculia bacterium]
MGWLERLFAFRTMEPTVGARVMRALGILLFLVIASICAVVVWAFPRQDRLATERDGRLETAPGTISATSVRHWKGRRTRGSTWELEVWYRYEVDGKAYAGRNVTFHHSTLRFSTEREALDARAAWADGTSVTVFYDSAEPSTSALTKEWKPVVFLVPFAAIICVICLLAAFFLVRDTLREARRSPVPAGEITRAVRSVRNVSATLAGASALLLAVHAMPIATHGLVVKPRLATATPLFMWDLDVHNGPPTPVSKYRFRPEGQEDWFEGRAWRFGRTGLPTLERAEAVKERLVDAHREDRLLVHYLPADPTVCALTPDHGGVLPRTTVLAASLCLAFMGLLAVVSARVLRRRPVEPGPPRGLRSRRIRS